MQYFINDKGQLVVILLHDSDGTDIVTIEDRYCQVDEISGELVEEND